MACVVHLKLNETTGILASDDKGNFDFDLAGFAGDDSQWLEPGLSLNGTDEYLDSDTSDFSPYMVDSFSVSFDYKFNSDTYYYWMGSAEAYGNGRFDVSNQNGALVINYRDIGVADTEGHWTSAADAIPTDSDRHNITIVFASLDNIYAYLDGVLLSSSGGDGYDGDMSLVDMTSFSLTNDIFLGCFNSNGSRFHYCDNNLYDFQLYDQALTLAQVQIIVDNPGSTVFDFPPEGYTQETCAANKFIAYPSPQAVSTTAFTLLHSDARIYNIPDDLYLPLAFQILGKDFAHPSDYQDPKYAELCSGISQLFYKMAGIQ